MNEATQNDILIQHLGRQIGELNVQVAAWEIRAMVAEQRLAELEQDQADEAGEDNVG